MIIECLTEQCAVKVQIIRSSVELLRMGALNDIKGISSHNIQAFNRFV